MSNTTSNDPLAAPAPAASKPAPLTPKVGDVIRYEFLWPEGEQRGLDSDKDRPCAVVVSKHVGDDQMVFVVPITTVDPKDSRAIPLQPGGALGLRAKSWIIPWALNTFRWMGPDVRHAPDPNGAFWRYGELAGSVRNTLAAAIRLEIQQKRSLVVKRTE